MTTQEAKIPLKYRAYLLFHTMKMLIRWKGVSVYTQSNCVYIHTDLPDKTSVDFTVAKLSL